MQYVQDSRIKGEGEGGEAARLDGWLVGWLLPEGPREGRMTSCGGWASKTGVPYRHGTSSLVSSYS